MNERAKKILGHVARLVVMAGLVAYVVSQTQLHDSVRPAPGAAPLAVVRETSEGPVVREPGGAERLIPRAEFHEAGAVRLAGISTILGRLADRWGYALMAVLVMMLQTPLSAVRWQLLLGVQNIHISFMESLRLTYIGWFFNNWLPGATGGDFIKAYYIARQTHHKPEAVTVVFLDRLIGLTAMCMLGAAAVVVSLGDERVRMAQVLVGAFLGTVTVGAGIFYSRRLRRWVRLEWLLAKMAAWPVLARVERALFVYRWHKRKVARSVVYSWGVQATAVLAMWSLAAGLGSLASWYHYFLNMPVIWIGWSAVPVPGGFGVAETLTQKLFTAQVLGGAAGPVLSAAEAATLALAMMLAYRVVQAIATLPGGVLYLMRRSDVSPRKMRDEMADDRDQPEALA